MLEEVTTATARFDDESSDTVDEQTVQVEDLQPLRKPNCNRDRKPKQK